MRVLVCGSRDWADAFMVNVVLDGIDAEKGEYDRLTVIHGDARGADSLAASWARLSGALIQAFPADWNRYGKRAGYVRNQQMLDEGKPDLVVAFRSNGESKGTDMMIDLAKKAGVPVYVVRKP